jgi:hypothetical protein
MSGVDSVPDDAARPSHHGAILHDAPPLDAARFDSADTSQKPVLDDQFDSGNRPFAVDGARNGRDEFARVRGPIDEPEPTASVRAPRPSRRRRRAAKLRARQVADDAIRPRT